MEGLEFGAILGASEVDALFGGDSNTAEEKQQDTSPAKEEKESEEKDNTTEITRIEDLFDAESESVGSEAESEEKESTKSKKVGSSPNTYSSIAKAFADDGIFPDLSDEDINKVDGPEAFLNLVNKLVESKVEERNKRADKALESGVEPTDVQKYEQTLRYLDSIKDNSISAESNEGENLRRQLLYQDFVNRGYNKERAVKLVERSFNAGTDIEDAREALKSNIEYFKGEYDAIINKAKQAQEKYALDRKEQAKKLEKSILEDKDFFGDLEVDKSTRQKIFDTIAKPVWKDPETGEYYTALQKYELDNHSEFMKNVGLLFTLTDGFKSLDKLTKNKVKKEVNKGIKSLEYTLNNTSRTPDGNLKFVTSVSEDPESFIGKGLKLDF